MQVVNMNQAKAQLSRLVQKALQGEDIVIARGTVPLVKLVPMKSERPHRVFGTGKGLFSVSEDFDAPLPDFDDYQ